MDVDHQERQESSRRHKPVGLTDGLHNGLTGFGLSLLGNIILWAIINTNFLCQKISFQLFSYYWKVHAQVNLVSKSHHPRSVD